MLVTALTKRLAEDLAAYLNGKEWFDRWGVWAVLIAGFSPIPFKVFTIAAGFFDVNFPIFVLASIVGRGGRFFLVAALLRRFGEPMKDLIDRWFNVLTLVLVVVFVAGFAVLKFFL